MKSIRSNLVQLVIIVGFIASFNLVHGQTTARTVLSTSAPDMVTMMEALESTTPMSAELAPIACAYYSAQFPAWPPLPCNINDLPIWNLGNGTALLDDLDFDYSAVSEWAQRDGRFQAMGMETSGTGYSPIYAFDTNVLWLEITNVSNGQAYLNLHNATNQVYAIWSTTNLPGDWQVETELRPTKNEMPFALPTSNRNILFLRAQDWTGLNTNSLPEWWLWSWFGNFNESSTSHDADGRTFQFDYAYGLDPSHVLFSLAFTNQYINTSQTCGAISVGGGYPYYVAVLVNDTNVNNAIWRPFTSANVPINFNNGSGTYTIGVGLKGFATNAQPQWQWEDLICLNVDTVPISLIVTNLTGSNVSVPLIQLQGLVSRNLSHLTYDVSNALGVVTNLIGYWNASFYDPNVLTFTTNTFQCYDINLTNGLNSITLHATDLTGNVLTTNFNYTLNYAGVTNVPQISIIWPQSTPVGGSNITIKAQTDDATANFHAVANGNSISGLVERSGSVWFQNMPLNAGTNIVTITATNAAGNINMTNLTIIQSTVNLTVNPIPNSQLNQSSVNLTGTVSDPSQNVWVNGIPATVDSYGNWAATNVPVNNVGMAELLVQAGASPNNNYGNWVANDAAMNNAGKARLSVQADVSQNNSLTELISDQVQPPLVTVLSYTMTYHYVDWGYNSWCMDSGPTIPYDATAHWTSGNGQILYHTIYWNADNCPVPPVDEDGETDLSGYINDYPVPWLNANNSSVFVPGNYLARLNAETKLVIKPSAKQQTGAIQTYIILVSALEYMANNIYDLENLESEFLADVDRTPIPPEQITVGGQNVVTTGITNTDGTTWGLASITAPTGVPAPLPITATLSNPNGTFVPRIQLAHLAIVDANSGVDFTMQTSNTVIVGQQMNLTAQLMIGDQVVTNIALANFQWTVPGTAISNYVVAADASSAVVVTTFPLNNSNVVFYWVDGASNRVIQCSAAVNGKTIAATATFNVYRPSVTFADSPPSWATNDMVDGILSLVLGTGDNGSGAGSMSYSINVSSDYSGRTDFTQLINRSAANGNTSDSTSGQYWMDNTRFYLSKTSDPSRVFPVNPNQPRPLSFNDGPSFALAHSLFNSTTSIFDQFEDYIVFRPNNGNVANNIYVPLGKITWSWSAATTYSGGVWSTPTYSVPRPSNPDGGFEFPQWLNIYKNN